MVSIRPAELNDAMWLSTRLRQADVDEIQASSGDSPYLALFDGIRESDECWIAEDHEPIAIFGISPAPGYGAVWMVGTDRFPKLARTLCRQTPLWLDRWLRLYPVIGNYVDERNTVHVRWLSRVGFTFTARHPVFGYEGRPFLEFSLRQDDFKCATQSPS